MATGAPAAFPEGDQAASIAEAAILVDGGVKFLGPVACRARGCREPTEIIRKQTISARPRQRSQGATCLQTPHGGEQHSTAFKTEVG